MHTENIDDQRKELPILGTDMQQFAKEIHQEDDVLLSKYSFTFQGKVLSHHDARSFLTFVRTQLTYL